MEGLKIAAEQVEGGLKNYFEKEISGSNGLEKELWQRIGEFTLRPAKRVRAALVSYGYKLFGGTDVESILFPMMAVELFHSGLLIHDDVIDEDLVRRGLPTFHAEMAKKYDRKYGESMAICAGDMALLAAEELLTEGKFADNLKLKAVKLCSRGIVRTAVGEALDSELQTSGKATEGEILEMLNLKTGIYTFANPLSLGAVLAGAGEDDLKILEEYSLSLGIAFQMTDDILGMFGDEAKTGKAADSDIRQGKMTLLNLKSQGDRFNKIYGKKDATDEEIGEVREIVREKALPEIKSMVEKYGNEAKVAVQKMKEKNLEKSAVEFLENLVTFVVQRES